jgi:hypothetical protein
MEKTENVINLIADCKKLGCGYIDFLLKIFSLFFPRLSFKLRGLRRRMIFSGRFKQLSKEKMTDLWTGMEDGGFQEGHLIYEPELKIEDLKSFVNQTDDNELKKGLILFDMTLLKNSSMLRLASIYTEESVLAMAATFAERNPSYVTYYQFVEALSTIALPIIESEEETEEEKNFCYIALDMLKSFEKKKANITKDINHITSYILKPFKDMLVEEKIFKTFDMNELLNRKVTQSSDDKQKKILSNIQTDHVAFHVKPIGSHRIIGLLRTVRLLRMGYFQTLKEKYDKHKDFMEIFKIQNGDKGKSRGSENEIKNILYSFLDDDDKFDETKKTKIFTAFTESNNALREVNFNNEVDMKKKAHEQNLQFWLKYTKTSSLGVFLLSKMRIFKQKNRDISTSLDHVFMKKNHIEYSIYDDTFRDRYVDILEKIVMFNVKRDPQEPDTLNPAIDRLYMRLENLFEKKNGVFGLKTRYKFLDYKARANTNKEIDLLSHFESLFRSGRPLNHQYVFYNFFANVYKAVYEYKMMLFCFPKYQNMITRRNDVSLLRSEFAKDYNKIFFADNLNLVNCSQNILSMYNPTICHHNVQAIANVFKNSFYLTSKESAHYQEIIDKKYGHFLLEERKKIQTTNVLPFLYSSEFKRKKSFEMGEEHFKEEEHNKTHFQKLTKDKDKFFFKELHDDDSSSKSLRSQLNEKEKLLTVYRYSDAYKETSAFFNELMEKEISFFVDKKNALLKRMSAFFLLFFNLEHSKYFIGSLMAKWKANYIMEQILTEEMKKVFQNAKKNLKIENVQGWTKKENNEEDKQNFNRMVDFVLKQPLNNFASKVFYHVSQMYINDLNDEEDTDEVDSEDEMFVIPKKKVPVTSSNNSITIDSDKIVQDLLDEENGKYKNYMGFENIRSGLIEKLKEEGRQKISFKKFTMKAVNLLETSNCQVYLDDEKKEKEEELERLRRRLERERMQDPIFRDEDRIKRLENNIKSYKEAIETFGMTFFENLFLE